MVSKYELLTVNYLMTEDFLPTSFHSRLRTKTSTTYKQIEIVIMIKNVLVIVVIFTFLVSLEGIFLIPTTREGSNEQNQICNVLNFIFSVQLSNHKKLPIQNAEDCEERRTARRIQKSSK